MPNKGATVVLLSLHWLVLQAPASASFTNRLAGTFPEAMTDWTRAESSAAAGPLESEPVPANSPTLLDFTPDPSWVEVALGWNIPYDQLHPLHQRMIYGFRPTNAGPATATSVVLTNPIPAALTDPVVTVSQGTYSISNNVLRWNVGTLAAGATAEVEIEVTPIRVGGVAITADVRQAQWDYNWNNNYGEVNFTLGQADLGVTIHSSPAEELQAGVPFQLTVVATNGGPDTPTAAQMYSSAFDNFIVVNYHLSQGQVIEFQKDGMPWHVNWGVIPPQGIARLVLTLIPKRSGTLSFTSRVSSDAPEPDEGLPNSASTSLAVGAGSGILEFASAKLDWLEGSGPALLEVRRRDGAAGAVQVSYTTENGSAIAGQDFLATAGTLMFLPGETNKTIAVPLLNNTQPDCNRLFTARLSNATGGALLFGATNLTVTILDDDLVPSGSLEPVAIPPQGIETGFGDTAFASISADGRWLAFSSFATNLVANDTNRSPDVFVKDLHSGEIRLVSVNRFGTASANGWSWLPLINADGRYIAFVNFGATDLVTNALPGTAEPGQIYVRDMVEETTQLVSVMPDGTGADWRSGLIGFYTLYGISSDGQVIAFVNDGNKLGNGKSQLFVRNLASGITTLITAKHDGSGPATSGNHHPTAGLSANGNRIVFSSNGRDLLTNFVGDFNSQVYVRDLIEGTTTPISRRYSDGGPGSDPSGWTRITPDGRFVVYRSNANDLVPDDDNPSADIFFHDLETGITRRISQGITGPCDAASLSEDGRFVAFRGGYRPGDANPSPSPNSSQIYLYDSLSNTLALVSLNCQGTAPANGHSLNPTLSADGRYVFFQSLANDLTPGVFPPSVMNFYRRDLQTGSTVLVTQNRSLTGGGSGDSGLGILDFSCNNTPDGTRVIVVSAADDLVYEDNNGHRDLFVWSAGGERGPRLSIFQESTEVVLRWPSAASNFELQSASAPVDSVWTSVGDNGTNEFRIQPSGQRYFRLKRSSDQ